MVETVVRGGDILARTRKDPAEAGSLFPFGPVTSVSPPKRSDSGFGVRWEFVTYSRPGGNATPKLWRTRNFPDVCAGRAHKPTRGTSGEGRWPILSWFARGERILPLAEMARLVTKFAEQGRRFALSARRRQDRQAMQDMENEPHD